MFVIGSDSFCSISLYVESVVITTINIDFNGQFINCGDMFNHSNGWCMLSIRSSLNDSFLISRFVDVTMLNHITYVIVVLMLSRYVKMFRMNSIIDLNGFILYNHDVTSSSSNESL